VPIAKELAMEETDIEQYIIIYYHNLLTMEEKLAYKHHITTEKVENSSEEFGKILMKRWGTTNKEALKLLEGGYGEFKKKVARRILSETPDKVFINNCPKCGKLARTPEAKQCRFCGHDWH
tara:strand:+ start:309929 stop:310291 length:363 start_codon:yes stop_codon:yes gene_type:complete